MSIEPVAHQYRLARDIYRSHQRPSCSVRSLRFSQSRFSPSLSVPPSRTRTSRTPRRGPTPVTYDIDFRVIVTAPQNTKKLRVWVPVPQSDKGQEVKPGTFATFPTDVKPTTHTEPVFGNTFAYFEFDNPQGAQIIAHSFKATVWEQRWNVDAAKVTRVEKWPARFDPYRRGESQVVVDDKFKKLADAIAGGKPNPAAELDAILAWAHDNLTYDHTNTSLVASSEHALDKEARRLQRLPRAVREPRPVARRADARRLRAAPVPEEPAVPLQARSVPPALRVGEFRRVRNAAAHQGDRGEPGTEGRREDGAREGRGGAAAIGVPRQHLATALEGHRLRPRAEGIAEGAAGRDDLRRGRRQAAAAARPGRPDEARVRVDDRAQVHTRPRGELSVPTEVGQAAGLSRVARSGCSCAQE